MDYAKAVLSGIKAPHPSLSSSFLTPFTLSTRLAQGRSTPTFSTLQETEMSRTDAWLVLIAGVSLLSVAVSGRLELNAKTCNRVLPSDENTLDPNGYGMKCFLPQICSGATSVWEATLLPTKRIHLDTCPAMIAIRPSPNGLKWMVVMQLRGTEVDHSTTGIQFYAQIGTDQKFLAKCHLDGERTNVELPHDQGQGGYKITRVRTSWEKDPFTFCEFWIEALNSRNLKDIFTGALYFKFKQGIDMKENKIEWDDWTPLLRNTARCNFPIAEEQDLTKKGEFWFRPSIWEKQVSCIAPEETVPYSDKFEVKFMKGREPVVAKSLQCDHVAGPRYEVIEATSTSSRHQPITATGDLKALCVAKACSMCATPSCNEGTACPVNGTDTTTECATLTCADGIYVVDGKLTLGDAPICEKTAAMTGNEELVQKTEKDTQGLEMKWVEWRFDGRPFTKIRCGSGIDCPGDLKVGDTPNDKKFEIDAIEAGTNFYNATCKESKLGMMNEAGDDVNKDLKILRLHCNRKTGVWNQVYEKDNKEVLERFNTNYTLKCYDSPAGDAVSGASTAPLMYAGGGLGVIAVIAIIVVVVWCCCCRGRKKKAADRPSMTAVSSGDLKKTSDNVKSEVKSAPKTTPSIPVTMEPMKPQPTPPRSDNVPEPKKEETKKEFLKFDDSNISDIQQVSKKHEETERLDVLQQEADKMSVEQKQKAEERKKAERDLYPRLADIDDDWNNSEEKKAGAGASAKKPQVAAVPSDKTTVFSKLNSNGKPLQNAPHDDGQYEALGMPTVMVEKTAIEEKTTKEDESGTSKKSTKTRTKMRVADTSEKKSGLPSELQTALDAKLADMEKMLEKTAILNEDEEGETQRGTQQTRTMMTGKTRGTTIAGTQSKDRTTVRTTQGGVTGAGATTQRTRTQTRTRGDPTQATQTRTKGDPTQGTQTRTRGESTQVPSFEGFTARDPTAGDETQAGTDGVTAMAPSENDPTQLTDGRTGREVTANDVTQGTDGRTAQSLTPVDFTQNRTRTPTGRTAFTKTRATRTQDQTTRTADQQTQDPTVINDPTQMLTRTRTSRTQDGTAFDGTQDPTGFDQTQNLTDGRTGRTRGASRTQFTRTGTTQDQAGFDGTQDPTAFDQTQAGGTRTTRTQETRTRFDGTQDPTAFDQTQAGGTRTTRTQGTRTRFDGTQDPTAFDQTQAHTDGRTGMTRTRASRTQDFTRTGATQDPTGFDGTQDPTAFDQTQMTGGRTRTGRTQAATSTGATQVDTRTGMTQAGSETNCDPTVAPSTEGRTGVTRTRARTTQDQTRDPTGTQETTMAVDGATQMTDGRTGVTRTRVTRTQDQTDGQTAVSRTKGRTTQDPTAAFDGTQQPTEGKTAVSRTKGRTTQGETTAADGTQVQTDGRTAVSRTKGRTTQGETTAADGTQVQTDGRTAVSRTKGRTTQDPTAAFDGTQQPTEGKTAVSRTKGRTTQGETTAADGTQLQTDGRTAVSRTKGRTTQGETTAADGTQLQTDGRTAVSRTKGRTTQGGTTAADGTQLQTDGRTAVSRTKGRTTQDGTAAFDGTQAPTDGQTALSKTKGARTQDQTTAVTPRVTTRTQDGTTAVADGTQVQTEGRTALSKTKGARTQEPTTAATPRVTSRTQEQTAAGTQEPTKRTRSKSQSGTKTPADTQGDGLTADPKERSRDSRTGAEATGPRDSHTGAEGPRTQSKTGAEQPPSD